MFTKSQTYLKGAMILSLGGFVSKLLGAIYRIPLTNVLGSYGIGIYQMVYPLYCILLTISASGIPSCIARLVASKQRGVEQTSLVLFGVIGAVGAIAMYLFAPLLSALNQEPKVTLCCQLLAPSVFFVSLLSVVRGYFQGKGNMIPTALTEISEQFIKVFFGTLLAFFFRHNVEWAVGMALFAVTVSELITCLIALNFYQRNHPRALFVEPQPTYRTVLHYTIPLTLTALALPFSQLLEGIMTIRILNEGIEGATQQYGIFSGCAVTLIHLPVSLTYGLAVAGIPPIASLMERGEVQKAKRKCYQSLIYTALLSSICVLLLYVCSPLALRIIFRSLKGEEYELCLHLIRIMSVNALTLSIVQTSSACITALGTPKVGTAIQWASCVLRLISSYFLLRYTNLQIESLAISTNCAYFVAGFCNICYIIGGGRIYANHIDRLRRSRGRLKHKSKKSVRQCQQNPCSHQTHSIL